MCKIKFQTRMAEYSILQTANKRFYFETLLHPDPIVADLQSHFNMIRNFTVKLR